MIVLVISLSLLYSGIVIFLLVTWYKDIKQKDELEERILILEKRIIEFENTVKKDYKGIYVPIDEDFKVLLPLCEKDKFNLKSLEYAYNLIKNGEEVEEMACKKGRGGKKK